MADEFLTFTRDQRRDRFLQSYKIRAPQIDTSPGSLPYLEASVRADIEAAIYGNAAKIANSFDLENVNGTDLETIATQEGLSPARIGSTGSSGAVTVTTSTGGALVQAGDELRDLNTGLRYQSLVTRILYTNDQCPITAVDTGPATNKLAGFILTWSSPRPGMTSTCTVYEQADGSGLSGGADPETDAELRDRIRDARATPVASGNDAAYQAFIESSKSTISAQKCFTYPAVLGPGTIAITWTNKPAYSGGSRIPTAGQIVAVQNALVDQFPADDGVFVCQINALPLQVALQVDWSSTAIGWADQSPWPSWNPVLPAQVTSSSNTPYNFTLTSTGSGPVAGQTIAFYDKVNAKFVAKRIGSVTGSVGSFAIVCDTSNGASDSSYVPSSGDMCCPWSDSLNSVVPDVTAYFDSLGPGEQVSSPFDAGMRQKRQPENPSQWASTITSRMLVPLFNNNNIQDIDILSPSIPLVCTVGAAGNYSNMWELDTLLIFP